MRDLIEQMRALMEEGESKLYPAHHDHERCPDGSHWNDDDNKCVDIETMKQRLGSEYQKDADAAERMEKNKLHPSLEPRHHYNHWINVADLHRMAAVKARQKGFGGLGRHHGAHQDKAIEKARHFKKEHEKRFPSKPVNPSPYAEPKGGRSLPLGWGGLLP